MKTNHHEKWVSISKLPFTFRTFTWICAECTWIGVEIFSDFALSLSLPLLGLMHMIDNHTHTHTKSMLQNALSWYYRQQKKITSRFVINSVLKRKKKSQQQQHNDKKCASKKKQQISNLFSAVLVTHTHDEENNTLHIFYTMSICLFPTTTTKSCSLLGFVILMIGIVWNALQRQQDQHNELVLTITAKKILSETKTYTHTLDPANFDWWI